MSVEIKKLIVGKKLSLL